MNEEIKDMVENHIQNDQPVVEAQTQAEPPKSKTKEENFNLLRKKIEEAEARAEEAERRALQYQQQHSSPRVDEAQTTHFDPLDEEFVNRDPDDVAYNKTVQKTTKKLSSKLSETEKKMDALQQKLEYFETKMEIDSLKDFNEVVSSENVKTFARLYPDEYQTIMSAPNLRARSKMAYNMIKNYGIVDASPLLKTAEEIKMADKKIEANKQKPGAVSSMPPSPLKSLGKYDADGRLVLNDEDIDRINKEVRRKLGQ